jgi:glycosyltransferase involved in cell wall biosynthesis
VDPVRISWVKFDLVVATVDRAEPLGRLLASLERQTHRAFRVLVVDQNEDARVDAVLAAHEGLDVLRLRAPRGLSRARNAALPHLAGDVVAFPDDDCEYPDDLLERVAARLADGALDGLSGRSHARDGRSSPSWGTEPALLDRGNVWNRGISYGIFLRRDLVERVGGFDEQLGLGAGTPWSSGEEIDFLIRALDAGGRIAYDPALVVLHDEKTFDPGSLAAVGRRDGASVGYLLRRHGYGAATRAAMLVRPLGGAALAVARRDGGRARFHAATLAGRVRGLRGR